MIEPRKSRRIVTLVHQEERGFNPHLFAYSSRSIANLLGMNEESIRVRARRGKIDLADLEQVARYIVRKLDRKKEREDG